MPKVNVVKSARATKQPRSCTGCHKEIQVGEKIFTWARRFGMSSATYARHFDCGYPRPTELSARKTAQVEEAVQDAHAALGGISQALPEGTTPETTSLQLPNDEIDSIIEDVASIAESVGEEYDEAASNMPESLQYGQQAESMREVAQELADWAGTLRDWGASSETEVDLPDEAAYETPEEWREAATEAYEQATEALLQAAEEAIDEQIPEYQG